MEQICVSVHKSTQSFVHDNTHFVFLIAELCKKVT